MLLSSDTLNPCVKIIQGMSFDQDTSVLVFTVCVQGALEGSEDCTIKFITETLLDEADAIPNLDQPGQEAFQVSCLAASGHIADYPLLAYNSYLPDNSEIIVTNMAER